jgi:hypothetical protein
MTKYGNILNTLLCLRIYRMYNNMKLYLYILGEEDDTY